MSTLTNVQIANDIREMVNQHRSWMTTEQMGGVSRDVFNAVMSAPAAERTHRRVAHEFMIYIRRFRITTVDNLAAAIDVAIVREQSGYGGGVPHNMVSELMEIYSKSLNEGRHFTYETIENSVQVRFAIRDLDSEVHLNKQQRERYKEQNDAEILTGKRKFLPQDTDDDEEIMIQERIRARTNDDSRSSGALKFFDEDEDESTPVHERGAQRHPPDAPSSVDYATAKEPKPSKKPSVLQPPNTRPPWQRPANPSEPHRLPD